MRLKGMKYMVDRVWTLTLDSRGCGAHAYILHVMWIWASLVTVVSLSLRLYEILSMKLFFKLHSAWKCYYYYKNNRNKDKENLLKWISYCVSMAGVAGVVWPGLKWGYLRHGGQESVPPKGSMPRFLLNESPQEVVPHRAPLSGVSIRKGLKWQVQLITNC